MNLKDNLLTSLEGLGDATGKIDAKRQWVILRPRFQLLKSLSQTALATKFTENERIKGTGAKKMDS